MVDSDKQRKELSNALDKQRKELSNALDFVKSGTIDSVWLRWTPRGGDLYYTVTIKPKKGRWHVTYTNKAISHTNVLPSKDAVVSELMTGVIFIMRGVKPGSPLNQSILTNRRPEQLQRVAEAHGATRFAALVRGAATRRRIRLGQLPADRATVRAELTKNLAFVPAYTRGGRVPRGFQGGSRVRENIQSLMGVTPDGYGGFLDSSSAIKKTRFAPGTKTHNGTRRGGGPGNYLRQLSQQSI
jgi:hypothetical protein